MFPFLNVLLVSLLMVSDRDHFWDAEKISKETEVSWDSLQNEEPIDVAGLKDKKVLLVVHGFNNAGNIRVQTGPINRRMGALKMVKK